MPRKSKLDEPNMSDTTVLITVEDLINRAMGPPDANVVDFKLVQTILHILARQQRLLEQKVEIRIADYIKLKGKKGSVESSESSESEESPRRKARKDDREQKKADRSRKAAPSDRDKAERATAKEREKAEKAGSRDREKADRAASKEREKAERAVSKDRERAERAASKERGKAEKAALKDAERAERATSREREKAEKAALKDAERTAKADRASSKEREKAEKAALKDAERQGRAAAKEAEKAERATSKEREKAEKAALKDAERAERAASKEAGKAERASSKEREKAEKAALKDAERQGRAAAKEAERADRATSKEREKADKAALKDAERAERASSKEKEKAEKAALKDAERAERASSKEREKADKAALKDAEKAEKATAKEREKAEKTAKKDAERTEKASSKEKEKAEKQAQKDQIKSEKEKEQLKKGRQRSDSSISVSETMHGKEKVLLVEKGPTTRTIDHQARSSIEVVTQSQFAMLKAAVMELKNMAAPVPLSMPDNKKLRSDLAKGQATLPDTMQAMQIDARVKAAEDAISRMTGLLTQLTAAGGVPKEVEQKMAKLQEEREVFAQAEEQKARAIAARKSVLIAPDTKISEDTRPSSAPTSSAATTARPSVAPTPHASMSIMKQAPSMMSSTTIEYGVSREEMDNSIHRLREDLIKTINLMTSRAGATADNALHTSKAAAERVDVALTLDKRITNLSSLAADYNEQLQGFDAGLATQMQSFKEQIMQIQTDLNTGLAQLESINNNAETAAVAELTQRYQDLVSELDATLVAHRSLNNFQSKLSDELRSLVECVELMREQKADRDEVDDGLRDKADTSRLAGLLTEAEFAMARSDLERRLAVCHDKFQRQDNIWMTAIKDLNRIMEQKSEILDLMSLRDDMQKQLQQLLERLQVLAGVIGEPKAAVVKRALAAACAACGTNAFISPRDASKGAPPRLPALRPPPVGAPSEICIKEWMAPEPPDERHVCHRWCGGSHTLMSDQVRRAEATEGPELTAPTKRYVGYGSDGRLYMMEEELAPCVECNLILEEEDDKAENEKEILPVDLGAGDQKPTTETIVNVHLLEESVSLGKSLKNLINK